jgi:hypothetical protein
MITKLVIWMLNKLFNSKNRTELEPCIKELYGRMAAENFEHAKGLYAGKAADNFEHLKELYRGLASKNLKLRSEIVKVKKGKRRYDLLFIETKEGKFRFNLGRHWEENKVFQGEISKN